MMNEELYIKNRLGNRNPFRVPEGYFDNLTAEIMKNCQDAPSVSVGQPKQPDRSKVIRLRPWLYAAACLFVAIFTVAVYFAAPTDDQQVAATTPTMNETYYDDAADYVMADNIDIYACLASEY